MKQIQLKLVRTSDDSTTFKFVDEETLDVLLEKTFTLDEEHIVSVRDEFVNFIVTSDGIKDGFDFTSSSVE